MFIENLKYQPSEPETKMEITKSPEIEKGLNPVVITGVTFGKELHAGHILLLTFADILRSSIDSQSNLIVINNNTGPRPAAALATLSEMTGLDIQVTAKLLDSGFINHQKIVDAYRARENLENSEEALKIVDSGEFDVFALISQIVGDNLSKAGFEITIIPESSTVNDGFTIIDKLNRNWTGTGFTVFPTPKGLKVLQKGGSMTATGKGLSSFISIAKNIGEDKNIPYLIFVDGSPDSADTAICFSEIDLNGIGAQIPGTAISFDGKIASGTKGEALTLPEIISEFKKRSPKGDLLKALKFMVLTKPVLISSIKNPNIIWATFDFKDNAAFVHSLAASYREYLAFSEYVKNILTSFDRKIGDSNIINDKKIAKSIEYLPLKVDSIRRQKIENILSESKKTKVLKNQEEIYKILLTQGYSRAEAGNKSKKYIQGPQGLAFRGNYFFDQVKAMINLESSSVSLTPEIALSAKQILELSMKKLGI